MMGKEELTVYEFEDRRYHAIRRGLIFLGAVLLTFIILLGFAALIIWLVLRPIHTPSWSLENIEAITLNVVQTTNGNGRRLAEAAESWNTFYEYPLLNADLVFTLEVCNPNKKLSIIYDRIDVSAAYATAIFGKVCPPITPFIQGKWNTTIVKAELKAMSVSVAANLGSAIQSDILNDKIMFQIHLRARARVKIGGYTSFGFGVRANCEVAVSAPDSYGHAGQLLSKWCRT